MEVVIAELPGSIVFAYDGDLLILDKNKYKELIQRDTGRAVEQVFEEVFSARGVQSQYGKSLSYQCLNLLEMVEF